MTARIAIASVLAGLQIVILAMGGISSQWSLGVCAVYLLATIVVRIASQPRRQGRSFDLQWLLTIGVDVVAVLLLDVHTSGINYAPLFVLPVLLAAVLGPIRLAFGTAATVTVLLMAQAWWTSLQGLGEFQPLLLQAALSGSGLFFVALLANQLATRLAHQEQRAKASQLAAQLQTQVNDLVIETLAEGVLVVDTQGIVRSLNPACRALLSTDNLSLKVPFSLTADGVWLPLVQLMTRTFATRLPQQSDATLEAPDVRAKQLRVRTRLTTSTGANNSLCVMFLEDLREMEARVRTEKLAAMGRMSAAVAHEIRNPLAAISQANALLAEDLKDPVHRQLAAMVTQNSRRLAKIVDEILNVARVQEQLPAPEESTLALDEAVRRITADWGAQNAAAHRLSLVCQAPSATVWFDPEHLRRILVNLLDNALRHSNPTEQSVQVTTEQQAERPRLAVWSLGEPLEKSVQAHLFEPFFSSEARSSGLGLYICRELCERYGAHIDYQRSRRGQTEGNEFFIVLKPVLGLGVSRAPSTDNPMTIC